MRANPVSSSAATRDSSPRRAFRAAQLLPALCLLLALCAALAGCKKEPDDSYTFTLHPNTPSSKELVEMILDPSDPDRRREGIQSLSKRQGGMDDTALKLYAVVASNPKEDVTVRCVAVGALGRSGNPKYISEVLVCLGDANGSLRWDAASALDNLVAPVAVEPLRSHAIADPVVDVRACSARALRHYKNADVVKTLQRSLTDADYSVRHQAHAALVEIAGYDKGFDVDQWEDLAFDLRARQNRAASQDAPKK